MSSAFDTTNEDKIIDIAEKFMKKEEMRTLQTTILLLHYCNLVKSNTENLQNDAISSLTFTIPPEHYLNAVRAKVRKNGQNNDTVNSASHNSTSHSD